MSRLNLASRLSKLKVRLVSVGDRTTERLIDYKIEPGLQIIDGIERREPRRRKPPFSGSSKRILPAMNPAGTISSSALKALSRALKLFRTSPHAPVRIEIEGEEDLLVLPVLAFFPLNTVVCYGQPGEGMVVVKAEGRARQLATTVLSKIGLNGLP